MRDRAGVALAPAHTVMAQTKPPVAAGYRSLVPLDRGGHRDLGVRTQGWFRFAVGLDAIYVKAPELFQVARHYPLAFARDAVSRRRVPVAITSFTQRSKPFVGDLGSWSEGVYIPACVRYPFFALRARKEGDSGNTPKAMASVGVLGRVYAHPMSLENFRHLLDCSAPTSTPVEESRRAALRD